MKFCTKHNLSAIWLLAFLLNVFSIAPLAVTPDKSAATVYCPLTKKFQPVKAQRKEILQNPLDGICAGDKAKKLFLQELFSKNLQIRVLPDDKKFEDLVFDYFQNGKSAFETLPPSPDSPRKNSIKPFSSIIGSGKTAETRFQPKSPAETFAFAQNARPPTVLNSKKYEFQSVCNLESISRNINPRSPPFFV